jgi:uncharacterized protein (DUF433 family)
MEPSFTRRASVIEQPAYKVGEAAAILSVPKATVTAWSFGQAYDLKDGSSRRFKALIEPADIKRRLLSFSNLCELHVLAAIRRRHRIDMGKVRASLTFVSKRLGEVRPLIAQDFLTNGIDLFIDKAQLINVSKDGQTALRGDFEQALARIERGPGGGAVRLFPYTRIAGDPSAQPRYVAVDPRIAFGRPVLLKAGVTTQVIRDRFVAGDSFAEMAADYRVSATEIEEALRFEQRLAA